jgi:carbamoyltransferase
MMGYNKHFEGNWKMCKDEGKLMGMAPDGYYDERIYNLLKSVINYKDLRFYPSNTSSRTQYVGDMLYYGGYFDNPENRAIYSFNLQKLTNDLFLEFLKDLHIIYPEYTKLCLTGGLFANVKLNQKINELDWVEEIYVIPPMGDEGLSLGACIYKANQLGEIEKPFHLNDVHFGQKYTDDEIFEVSKNYKFKREPYDVDKVAKEISEGGIIGWFQGGSEFGPRALGARSILVRPTDISTHKILNSRLKRHDTMPFAPIVLSEHFDNIFTSSKSKYTSEFMTLCYDTRDEWIDKIPAVIQKSDKTARPQIVVKDKLPKFWEILNRYYEISGIPVLLNTSFNSHNEPIIENPKQAFDSLEKNIIDKLVIGEYVYFIE